MADQVFELYKLLVEEVRDARRARRELANVFMTLNLAGAGALGFLASERSELDPALFAWCAAALVLTCLIWRTSNAYYVVLLTAKYREIYELEHQLGVSPLRNEYAAIERKRVLMKWFTLERAMPLLFVIGYIVFVAYQLTMDDVARAFEAFWAPARAIIDHLRGAIQ
jgi:hypothetical protein